ncbi:hypothetical protein LTR78_009672 [Recurvomyces mirabilis]|uniref:Uncharacterized protein n=1 Tax=Recurvomyces mirabilis TaxID=574656 RepID=A0AAE0WHA2_9PEZI|nr:hypothetical protein LTR78_009672 [Recurvomyces mirabilis]KAK5150286.1 hypothetical protein LTS14_010263 [Recurvomyces mirabilis]
MSQNPESVNIIAKHLHLEATELNGLTTSLIALQLDHKERLSKLAKLEESAVAREKELADGKVSMLIDQDTITTNWIEIAGAEKKLEEREAVVPNDDADATPAINTETYKDKVKKKHRELEKKIAKTTEENADMAERVVKKNLPSIAVGTATMQETHLLVVSNSFRVTTIYVCVHTDLLVEVLEKGEKVDAFDRDRSIEVACLALLAVQGLRPEDQEA